MPRINARWVAIATFFVLLDAMLLGIFKAGSDWAPLWTAGRLVWNDPTRIYDFELIARMQAEVVAKVDFHPFVYPPSALLLIAPIASLPFWVSLAAIAAGSLAWLAWTSRDAGSDPWLVLLAPPVAIAAIVGQPSLLVIGLVLLAFSRLQRDEWKVGVLLALAALIKPTLLVLAPIGLVAGGHWRALATATVVGIAGIALSALLFGVQPWVNWLHALPKFQQMFSDYPPLVRNAISPYATGVRFGLDIPAVMAIAASVAAVMVWIGFSRPSSPVSRTALVMGGALLLTPYAMNYELAVFAPAMLALPREQLRTVVLIALWGFSLIVTAGIVGLLVAYATVAVPLLAKRR